MAKDSERSQDPSLTDEDLDKAVGGTARATGAAGEGVAARHAARVAKEHRDARERSEESGN